VKGSILLVDDNEEFLDSTKDVLEEEDYRVVTAAGGEEAIRQVENSDFDVILMDIKMPGLNGVDTFVEMKKRKPGVKVVMCTAYIVESLIRRALEEGAYAVLNKPFEMNSLLKTLEMVAQRENCGVILVADRDKDLCAEIQAVLRAQGHSVVVASDGPDALRQAEQHSFDILILDINLSIVDGLEVHRRIRATQPGILFTIIVGYAEEMEVAVQQNLRKENGLTTLLKPVDTAGLPDLLAGMYASRRM
jgi:two-component system, NtrC family, response regulator HydG